MLLRIERRNILEFELRNDNMDGLAPGVRDRSDAVLLFRALLAVTASFVILFGVAPSGLAPHRLA